MTQLDDLLKLAETGSREAILAAWRDHIGPPPRHLHLRREVLALSFAFELQAKAGGGLSRAIEGKLARLARDLAEGKEVDAAKGDRIRDGVQIVREWRGRKYVVARKGDGFEFDGRAFASLSAIAREITGARWNGPAFFGLRAAGDRKGDAKNAA